MRERVTKATSNARLGRVGLLACAQPTVVRAGALPARCAQAAARLSSSSWKRALDAAGLGPDPGSAKGEMSTVRCDFCGEEAASVRRVALDREYDRLRTPHEILYACQDCSEKKERKRTGLG